MEELISVLTKLVESLQIRYVGEEGIKALIKTMNQFPYNIGKSFWIGTKAEYLALEKWDDNTIYFIKEIQAQDDNNPIEIKE